MPENSVMIYHLINSLTDFEKDIGRFRKEIDGVSFLISGEITEDLIKALKKVRDEGFKELLIFDELGKGKTTELIKLIKTVEPYATSLSDLGLIPVLKQSLEHLTTRLGVIVRNPFPNFQALKKVGAELVVMPTALIKGRVVKEAKASGLNLIAYLVNDPATYLKMRSSGVSGIITRNPGVVREAEKLKF